MKRVKSGREFVDLCIEGEIVEVEFWLVEVILDVHDLSVQFILDRHRQSCLRLRRVVQSKN